MNKKMIFLSIVVIAMSITGCGKKDTKVVVEDDEEIASDVDENKKESESIEGDTHKLDYEIIRDDSKYICKVNAEVVEPKKVNVYSATRIIPNEENIKAYCDQIFDGGDYTIIKPECVMSNEELTGYVSDLKAQIDEYDVYTVPVYLVEQYDWAAEADAGRNSDDEYYEHYFDPGIYEEGKLLQYSNNNGYGLVMVEGKIDGEEYYLQMHVENEQTKVYPSMLIPKKSHVKYRANSIIKPGDEPDDSLYNELKKQAEDAVVYAGFEDYEVLQSYTAVPFAQYKGESGYCFVFGRDFGEINQVFVDNNLRTIYDGCGVDKKTVLDMQYGNFNGYTKEEENEALDIMASWTQPGYVAIYVNNEGVQAIVFEERYELSEDVVNCENLQSFDTVNESAKKDIETNFKEGNLYYDMDVEINEVSLGYVLIAGEGSNEFMYVPCWIYYIYGSGRSRKSVAAINAIDGSALIFDAYGNDSLLENYGTIRSKY